MFYTTGPEAETRTLRKEKKAEVKRNMLANLRGFPTASFSPWFETLNQNRKKRGHWGFVWLADLVLDLVMKPRYLREHTLGNKGKKGEGGGIIQPKEKPCKCVERQEN